MKYIYKGKTEFEYEIDWGLEDTYSNSLKKLHPEINWESVTIGNYQGDIISIGYDKEFNWYYKNNSYGSCSGCDWIQGIDTEEGAINFYKSQENIDCLGKNVEKVKEYIKKEVDNCWGFEKEDCDKLLSFIELNQPKTEETKHL